MDENNFSFEVDGHTVAMENGILFVDDVEHEDDPQFWDYSIARAYWRDVVAKR